MTGTPERLTETELADLKKAASAAHEAWNQYVATRKGYDCSSHTEALGEFHDEATPEKVLRLLENARQSSAPDAGYRGSSLLTCTGCGGHWTREELDANGQISCCPERDMVAAPPEGWREQAARIIDPWAMDRAECDPQTEAARSEALAKADALAAIVPAHKVEESASEQLLLQAHDALEAAREMMRGATEPEDVRAYDRVNAALYAVRSRPTTAQPPLSEPSPGLVEAGWVMVPREPTREMWAASGDAVVALRSQHHDAISETVWTAMLSAAPSQGDGAGHGTASNCGDNQAPGRTKNPTHKGSQE